MERVKLFLLRYEEASYCDTEGFVIRAETEEQVRAIAIAATTEASSGWGVHDLDSDVDEGEEYTHDPTKITCVEVFVDGEPGVVLCAKSGS